VFLWNKNESCFFLKKIPMTERKLGRENQRISGLKPSLSSWKIFKSLKKSIFERPLKKEGKI